MMKLEMQNPEAPFDERRWSFKIDGHALIVRSIDDSGSAFDELRVERQGCKIVTARPVREPPLTKVEWIYLIENLQAIARGKEPIRGTREAACALAVHELERMRTIYDDRGFELAELQVKLRSRQP